MSHLQAVLAALKAQPARHGAVRRLPGPAAVGVAAARTPACRSVKLPFTVGGSDGAKDLFGLFDDTLARLLAAAASR